MLDLPVGMGYNAQGHRRSHRLAHDMADLHPTTASSVHSFDHFDGMSEDARRRAQFRRNVGLYKSELDEDELLAVHLLAANRVGIGECGKLSVHCQLAKRLGIEQTCREVIFSDQ